MVSSAAMSSGPSGGPQIRLILVEDVPQVAQYVRNLLNSQSTIKLLDVISDGGKALGQIAQLRPDVVIVDALLQGRLKGLQLVEQISVSANPVPVVVVTVPQQPVAPDVELGIHGVLTMPFSGYDLVNKLGAIHKSYVASDAAHGSRVVSVFAPKGGVGKTTIAFNLACAIGQVGQRTVLIDGSLQFGDLRALLKVPGDAPSIIDLPTDRIAESDLQDVLWRDPSGIDILLAPPRIEQAEMITTRDVDKILSILRRVYQCVVIDMGSSIGDLNLAFLDASDTIVEIVTYDSTTIHNTIKAAEAFRAIGYPPTKVRYLVNRADSPGGMTAEELERALGRVPEYQVMSDGRLVVQANNDGVPFVLAEPDAAISRDLLRIAGDLVGAPTATAVGAAARR
jgi:pilus assembly protein CpaE